MLISVQVAQPIHSVPDEVAYIGYAFFIGVFLYFVFYFYKNWYAAAYDKPLFRNFLTSKNVSSAQKHILSSEFSFYNRLQPKEQSQFEHRVASFIKDKEFVGRENLVVTERMKTLIAAVACMLSFGRRAYLFKMVDHVLLYPDEFYSNSNEAYHKGEFNPKQKLIVFSWKDFEHGFQIENDNFNLGLHEFMHALHIEAKAVKTNDGKRLEKYFQKILHRLTNQDLKNHLDDTRYFRTYAFTNQFEFMAVLAEYFFESPQDLNENFPQLYMYVKKMLNMQYAGY